MIINNVYEKIRLTTTYTSELSHIDQNCHSWPQGRQACRKWTKIFQSMKHGQVIPQRYLRFLTQFSARTDYQVVTVDERNEMEDVTEDATVC